MKRRSFLQRMTAAAAATPWLLGSTQDLSGLQSALSVAPDEPEFWREVRSQFLMRPGLTHMNSATIGATPRPVVSALSDFLWETESDPQDQLFGAPHGRMDEVREKASAFIGASLAEVALMRNTTEGMNAVAQGIELKRGDQILTTNHEHPGGSVCWEYYAAKTGAEIVRIEMPAPVVSEEQIVDLVSFHITPRTRVCSFSHVCTITGLVMPLARISEITRPRDIFLVCDGAQAPGMLDVNVHDLGVDTYAASSHKWMLAPKGTGLLNIREGVQDRIKPLFLHSGFGAYTASSGTRNVATLLAHGVAMDFHNTIGRGKVEARCRELRARLRTQLDEMDSVTVLTPREEALSAGIVTISLKEGDFREVRRIMLEDHGFVLKTGKAEYNAIRISTHIFNDEDDVDRLAEALRGVLA